MEWSWSSKTKQDTVIIAPDNQLNNYILLLHVKTKGLFDAHQILQTYEKQMNDDILQAYHTATSVRSSESSHIKTVVFFNVLYAILNCIT